MKEKNYYPRPLWFWNEKPTKQGIREIMENCARHDKYGGFGVLPYDACGLEYMGEEYLELYGYVLQEAKRLGLKICLYDEWWFPSGWAGGFLRKNYPEACAKRLDMEEYTASGTSFSVVLPTDGKRMAVVGMKGKERIDLSPYVKENRLEWHAPAKDWLALCFILRDAGWDHADYLSAEAVNKFIGCTHEVYYRHFSEYFGNVIDSAFYDEPQFYGAEGRMWTEKFNERFEEKYQESPALYYPALFYDIGEDTAFARNALLSLRADLYAESFPGTIQKWCTAHGISLTGHVDQEEVENPCGITGDLMKSFRFQDIPGVDEIAFEGRASSAYKIVSSAAVNWSKKLVMCECFGAMNDLKEEGIYRESFDLFTKGVNLFVPHAVWYSSDKEKIVFPPELSYRDPYFGKIMPAFSEYYSAVARCLQNGGQVNSVAVLYPIESLQADYTFNWGGNPYLGGPTGEKNDYMRLGQTLSRELNIDFTFLHPEVLTENCTVEKGLLRLASSVHFQAYTAVILPGMKTISWKALEKLKQFVRAGGTLISVSQLPSLSAEKNMREAVADLCEELFGVSQTGIQPHVKYHDGGGKCYCLPGHMHEKLHEILLRENLDTKIISSVPGLQYIHKRAENDVWYFAALSQNVETQVALQGRWNLRAIDPAADREVKIGAVYTESETRFPLTMPSLSSLLVLGSRK